MASKTPTWAGKAPADMDDSELRAAKEAVHEALVPAQDRLNTLSAAVTNLDAEINSRFKLSTIPTPNPADYPLDAVQAEFGATSASS